MLNQIDLNLLVIFEKIAGTLSVKQTAAVFNVTPSAISQAMAKLENAIGTQLFIREHKKIILSPAGIDLLSRINQPLAHLQNQIEDFSKERNSKSYSGTIAIGCPSEFGSRFVIKWFSKFQKKYPDIKIKMRLGSPNTLLVYLAKGEVDFLIADDGPYYKEVAKKLSIKELFYEELIVCASQKMEGVSSRMKSFEAISTLPHLDYAMDCSAIGIWYKYHFNKAPKKLNPVLVSENVRALILGIQNGVGIAMIPKYLVKKQLESGEFIQISPTANKLMNALLLIQHNDKIPTTAEKLFLDMLEGKQKVIE